VQRCSDERKESRVKHDRSVAVQWHVHRHQPLYSVTNRLSPIYIILLIFIHQMW